MVKRRPVETLRSALCHVARRGSAWHRCTLAGHSTGGCCAGPQARARGAGGVLGTRAGNESR